MDNLPCDPDLPMKYRANLPVTPTDNSTPNYRHRFLIVLAILFLVFFPVISETYYHCAVCGMKRTRWRVMIIGIPLYTWNRPTSVSDWYQVNIEPEHEHVWVQTGYMEGKTICGLTTFMLQDLGMSTGPFVYLPLGRTGQIDVYKKSPDPQQARALFLRFAQHEPYGSVAYKEQQELFIRFNEWRESNMEAPWPFEKFP